MLCACMCFVYVYTWICMHMEGYTCGYAGIYRCMCVFVSAWLCMHVNVHVCMWKWVCCAYARTYTHVFPHVQTHMHVRMCDHAIFHRQQFLLGCYGNHCSKNVNPTPCGPEKAKAQWQTHLGLPRLRQGITNSEAGSPNCQGCRPTLRMPPLCQGLSLPPIFPSVMISGYLLTSSSSVNWSE